MHFLQSPKWEEFQRALGRTTHRIAGALVLEHRTPLGVYWYVGRAKLAPGSIESILKAAKQAGVIFVRVDPMNEVRRTPYAVRTTQPTQPQTTLVLNLDPSETELLASFHEKTRYNIRLAERAGITIEESQDPNHRALAEFLVLSIGTEARQHFRYHHPEYYRTMLQSLNQGDQSITTSVLVAWKGDDPAAAMIALWTPETVYYLHGASGYTLRKFMAPYLLHWEAIKRAKERGAKTYDFWGIAPPEAEPLANHESRSLKYEYDQGHVWSGVTRFKLGFGGTVVSYPDSFDVVLDRLKYQLYLFLRTVRRTVT